MLVEALYLIGGTALYGLANSLCDFWRSSMAELGNSFDGRSHKDAGGYPCLRPPLSLNDGDPTVTAQFETDIDEPTLYYSNLPMSAKRHNRKNLDDMHVLIEFDKDTPLESQDFFWVLCHSIDEMCPVKPMRKITDTVPRCKRCKGLLWKECMIEPGMLKRLAQQLGMEVAIRKYKRDSKCKGTLEWEVL